MQDEKIENQLNMALEATPDERERSSSLNTGYDISDNTWEVVVRYNGGLDELYDMGITVTILNGGYAVLNLNQSLIEEIARLPQIEYIEKPKSLYFEVQQGKSASCFTSVYNRLNLTGRDILVAVIDSGVDYAHPDFINDDGTTRILYLWDQSVSGNPPKGYNMGTEYTAEQINEALRADTLSERNRIVPSRDVSGHGTHVLGIACGNGRASGGKYTGCAPQADIIAVKLGSLRSNAFPMTTELMQGINYVINKAAELNKPVAVNISFGNSYGSHTGTSLIETFIDEISGVYKSVICIGTGNEGAQKRHYHGRISDSEQNVEILVYEYTPAFSIQIWKNYYDDFNVTINAPDGTGSGTISKISGTQRISLYDTEILIYYGEPTPYSLLQEIYIEMIPNGNFFSSGIWSLKFSPVRIVDGDYNIWLPAGAALSTSTSFLVPSAEVTLTIPSTARRAISVGAYNSNTMQPAPFSGRGYPVSLIAGKPEIVAPGVDITSAAPGGSYDVRSGTSMATPFVTGAAALLMQWGIVEGNDPFLYGEKVKAYLINGARQLPGQEETPNPITGFGALCVAESIPR